MDEVLNQLDATTISENNIKSNFNDLYKFKERFGSQEHRRADLLKAQKSNRAKSIDNYRGILDLVNYVSDNVFKTKNRVSYKPTITVSGFNKVIYREVLMLSEWMTEKPLDFETNWLVVPCPKGTRTMIIASNGSTKVFSKHGQFMFECHTMLPGGNLRNSGSCCCVLDCIYIKSSNTMYVLDILAWNSQPMTDGECEFRYFWLKTYVAELEGISSLSNRNNLIFKILEKHPCDKNSLNNVLITYPYFESNVVLDGILFYHKNAHYVSGESPVTVWLYPFMVPEVIDQDITVSLAYMLEKPANYTTQAAYIETFELRLAKKKARKSGRGRNRNYSEMDTTASDANNTNTSEISEDSNGTPKIEAMEPDIVNEEKPKTEAMESEIMNEEKPKTETTESEIVAESNGKLGDEIQAEPITDAKT